MTDDCDDQIAALKAANWQDIDCPCLEKSSSNEIRDIDKLLMSVANRDLPILKKFLECQIADKNWVDESNSEWIQELQRRLKIASTFIRRIRDYGCEPGYPFRANDTLLIMYDGKVED